MNNKVVENIIAVIVFLAVVILSFSFTVEKSKEQTEKLYESPLQSITILDNTINLEEDKRTYVAIVDCSKYEENVQLVNYKLKTKDNNVQLNSNFYRGQTLLDEPSKDMTNFEINLSVRNEKQEVVYHFMLECGI